MPSHYPWQARFIAYHVSNYEQSKDLAMNMKEERWAGMYPLSDF